MRKLIVMGVAVLFVVYCVLATQRQNLYSVPQSRVVTVDIIEGATLEHFLSDAYGSKRHERVASLERRHLHPIKPQPIPADKGAAPARIVQPDQQLLGKDFEALARAGQTRIEVRDPADLLAFARRKLELRQDLKAPDGTVIAPQGAHVNKAVLEAATEKGITEISVVGSGDVVGINGTMPMVILIFVAMVTVLKSILWEPLCALVDRRNEELRAGLHFQRTHRAQVEKLEAERLLELPVRTLSLGGGEARGRAAPAAWRSAPGGPRSGCRRAP